MLRAEAAALIGLLGLLSVAAIPSAFSGSSGTIVYLVRHAEKAPASEDPPLSEVGARHAQQLAHLLRDAGIETIYTTDFRRTRATAAPLATQLGLTPRIYDWDQLDALADDMRRTGGRYLVVGHSDTTPELVGLLGGDPGPPIDEQVEYDRLYIVSVSPGGEVATILLRFGDTSSP